MTRQLHLSRVRTHVFLQFAEALLQHGVCDLSPFLVNTQRYHCGPLSFSVLRAPARPNGGRLIREADG